MKVVVALGLLLASAGLWLVGSSLPSAERRTVTPAIPVNAGAGDPMDIRAHNSPSLARNPTDADQLVVSGRVDSPRFACALYVSHDGGDTWAETEVPVPEGEDPKCFAPDVAFGADGTLHVSFVTLAGSGNVPNAGWVTSSADGGRTLSSPVRVLGPLSFQVRLLADPQRAGRLWLTWLQADEVALLAFASPGNPINILSSDDGGATWGQPVRISPQQRQRVVAPSPTVGGDGRLHVAYLDVGDDSLDYHGGHQGRGGEPYPGAWRLIMATSVDNGATWSESVPAPRLTPTERFVAFLAPFPSVATDRSGDNVYVSFADGRRGDSDVWLWASSDGATTWDAGRRVNDTPVGDATSQYLPRLAVAPDGRLDVVYYDRRADPGNVMNEVSLQSSTDGGRSFTPRLNLSGEAFDSRIGFGSERAMPDLGSRLALDATTDQAVAVWSDTRSGTQASGKQDLALARVSMANGRLTDRLALLLRVLAVALGLAGLAICFMIGRGLRLRQRPGAAPP